MILILFVGITNLDLDLKIIKIMFRVNFGIFRTHQDSQNLA